MISTEMSSAGQQHDDRNLVYALETAVRAKQALWDALQQLAELGYPGEEPPDLVCLDRCVMELAICSEPNDMSVEDAKQLLNDARRETCFRLSLKLGKKPRTNDS